MQNALIHDIGARLKAALALIPAVITAGAGNDGVEVNGPGIDLFQFGNSRPRSGKLVICWSAVLAQGATLSIAANLQDAALSNFASGAADYGDPLANAVVATGPSGGGTVQGVSVIDVELSGSRQYQRAQVTANLSAANTDTVAIAAVLVVGGFDQLPAS